CGRIKLYGNKSARSNYRMKYNEKNNSFIWFHQANTINSLEPDFDSFVESHFFEKKQRKYKVIIDFKDIKDKKIYINPVTRNILVSADIIYCEADLHKDFNWYNDRVYYRAVLKSVLKTFLIL